MSWFPVIRHLTSMAAKAVAEHLKAIFSEFGVPDVLISDNGPCYTGEQFKVAMRKLNTCDYQPPPPSVKWVGRSHVRIVKNLLSKAKETGEDYHEVISIYRNTPINGKLPSPFELLHNRKPNSDLPKWEKRGSVPAEDLRSTCKMHRQQRTMYCQLGHT